MMYCADYVNRFATKEAAEATAQSEEQEEEEQEMSEVGSFSDEDEVAGRMEL
jgi:ubiquitin-conjugating enzyme E2 H